MISTFDKAQNTRKAFYWFLGLLYFLAFILLIYVLFGVGGFA